MMRTPNFWHEMNALSLLMSPLSLLYVLGARLHRAWVKPQRLPIPVISVGNVTSGGAGKTPATIAIAELLTTAGETPHILNRGYGVHIGNVQRVDAGSDWRRVGDEALLLAKAAPCWSGRNRVAAGLKAKESGASLVILDDGLQHYKLHKDISFLVIDGAYGLGNGMPLPAGPLREPLKDALARTHAVILVGEDAHGLRDRMKLPVFEATIEPAGDPAPLRTGTWLAFAGLARPEKFFDGLKQLGVNLAGTVSFPDHHPYSDADMHALLARAEAQGAALITTAKDAVKLSPELRNKVTVLDIALRFKDAATFTAWLKQHISAARA